MADESKDQRSPESPLDLKDFEYQEMRQAAREINPRAPEDILNIMTATTAVENILAGSSPPPGAVFHPNLPLAYIGGKSLEEINLVRRERNAIVRPFSLRVGDDFLLVYFEYLDLTEEHLHNSQLRTFRVAKASDLEGNKIDASGDLDELIAQKISAVVEKERRELEKRSQGKGKILPGSS